MTDKVDWDVCRSPTGPSIAQRNKLAKQNDKLALKIAHRMRNQCSEEIEDLAQMARIGLLWVIPKYDPDESAFSSFAVPYIRGEIQHFLRDHWGLVKVPRRYFEQAAQVRNLQKKAEKKLGRPVEAAKVAAALGIDADRWQEIVEATQRKPLANIDDISYAAAPEDVEDEGQTIPKERLYAAIARLPRIQRDIVTAHYFGKMSIAAIARTHSLGQSEASNKLESALTALRQTLEAQ